MATVAELKAGECEWEVCRVKGVWPSACEKDGTKAGRAEHRGRLFGGHSAASGPAERPAGVASAAPAPWVRETVAQGQFGNQL